MSNNFLPKITIITPVKNSVDTLEKAIKSLISQNYPNLEYIVLDGLSTDGTVEVIKKYEKYINFFQSKGDRGSVDACIKGIREAKSDIVGLLNADDFYEPEILLKAGKEFAENPEIDMVSFGYRVIKNNSDIISQISSKDMELKKDQMIKNLGINARFFKKDLFYKHGFPIDTDDQGRTFISNDLEFMIRFLLKGVKNKNIDYIGYNYSFHPGSLTFNNDPSKQRRLMEDKIFIAKKFLSNQNELPLTDFWKAYFTKWIKKYRAKLIKSHLKSKNYREAGSNFYSGLRENNKVFFIFYLFKTLLRGN